MSNVYKVTLGVLVMIALTFVMDRIVGGFMRIGYEHARFGIIHRQQYCLHESNEDILIMGSSRAAHHYVPEVFTDSLGLSCYNCGSDGQCVYYTYAILSAYVERGSIPKMVICEVMPQDIEESMSSTFNFDAAADRLAPNYGEFACVDSLLESKGWKAKVKLKSLAYRYNSKQVQLIKCNVIGEEENNGYEPLFGSSFILPVKTEGCASVSEVPIEQEKVNSFKNIIALCKKNGIKLIMAYSPTFGNSRSVGIDIAKSIAELSDVPFIDFGADARFDDPELFKDASHLNDGGARLYSGIVAETIMDNYVVGKF